jgi:hypothetical protein
MWRAGTGAKGDQEVKLEAAGTPELAGSWGSASDAALRSYFS